MLSENYDLFFLIILLKLQLLADIADVAHQLL